MASQQGSMFTEFAEYLEQQPALGRLADRMDAPLRTLVGRGPLADILRGRAFGHAIHPALVQLPIGTLASALTLDLTQGKRAAAQSRLLTGLTVLTALPAAASGLAEWTQADPRSKRVGVAHLGLNVFAVVCASGSYLIRLRKWSAAGALLNAMAVAAVSVSGALGGHLTLVRKYASHDPATDDLGVNGGAFSQPDDSKSAGQ